MLNPDATNIVTCIACKWSRIHDPMRSYRGGHTRPDNGAECHEPLLYLEIDPRAPEVVLLGEADPIPTVAQINGMEPELRLSALLHRDDVLARLRDVYPDADRARDLLEKARSAKV